MSMRKQIGDFTSSTLNDYLVFRDAEIAKGVTDNPTWIQIIPNNSTDMNLDGGMQRDFYIRTGDKWIGSTLGDRTPYFTGVIYSSIANTQAEIYSIFRDLRIFVNGVQLNNNLSASWDKVMATMIRDRDPDWLRSVGPNIGLLPSEKTNSAESYDPQLQFSAAPFGVGTVTLPASPETAIPFLYPIPAGYSLLGNREHPIPVPFLQELRVQVVANQANRMCSMTDGTTVVPTITISNLQLWVPAFEVKDDVASIFRDKLNRADSASGVEDMLVYLVNDIQVTTQSLSNLSANVFLNVPFNVVTTSANCVEVVVESSAARTDMTSAFKTLVSPHISISQYRFFFDGQAVDEYPTNCAQGTVTAAGRKWAGGDSRGWENYLDYVTTKNELYGYEDDDRPSNTKVLFDCSQYTSSQITTATAERELVMQCAYSSSNAAASLANGALDAQGLNVWSYRGGYSSQMQGYILGGAAVRTFTRAACPCTPNTVGGLFVMTALFSTDRNLLTTRPYSQANLQVQITYSANLTGGYSGETLIVTTNDANQAISQTAFGTGGFTFYMITHSHQFVYLSRSRCYVVS